MSTNDNQETVIEHFLKLPQPEDKVQCMHVWIDGTLRNFRTKDKTLSKKPSCADELPQMEFCGSATDFDVGNLADYYSKPVKFYKDPFRRGNNTIVYCETYSREGLPTFANNRYRLLATKRRYPAQTNRFTFFQSYTLLKKDGRPLTYLDPSYSPDSKSGCVCGREIAEAHYRACLYSGVKLASYESASNHGQWTYSIGPDDTVEVADDSWMSRFLLVKVAEDFGVVVSFESTLNYSCHLPIFTALSVDTNNSTQSEKQRMFENLISRFVVKEGKLVKVTSMPSHIHISNINSEIDPYAFLMKLLETQHLTE